MKHVNFHIKVGMVAALCLLFLIPGWAGAATYYVDSVAGSDFFAGTSAGAAWKTISKVNGFSRANLNKYSEQFNSKGIPVDLAFTADAALAPGDTQTAELATPATATGYYSDYSGISGDANGRTFTVSMWIKSAAGTKSVKFGLIKNGDALIGVDSTVSVTTTWTRYSVTAAANSTSTSFGIYFQSQSDTNTFYVWGGQIEEAATMGDYIKTVASVVSNSFSGDDIIYIKRGQRFAGNFQPPASGTDGHQITFAAYGSGSDPEISGTHVIDKNYITISGITFRGNLTWSGTNGVAQNIKPVGETILTNWNAPTQEGCRTADVNTFACGSRVYGETFSYSDLIGWWDYFTVNSFGGWVVTKTALGAGQSATYQLYSYTFTPAVYDRTVMVVAGEHGGEVASMLATLRFFYSAIGSSDSTFAPCTRTRYVVIPCANPWGLSQATRSYFNSRGIDIDANFTWNWSAFTYPGDNAIKGASAASEAETIIVKNLIDATMPSALLAMHTYADDSKSPEFPGYYPYSTLYQNTDPVLRVVDYLKQTGWTTELYNTLDQPTPHNYAASLGIAAFCPEYSIYDSETNSPYLGSAYMTGIVRWMGNIILAFSQLEPR